MKNGVRISAVVFALLIVAAGVLLIAFNAGFLPITYKAVIFSWPMLLVAIGFVSIFSRQKFIFGILIMLLGGFLLLPKLDIDSLSFLRGNGWAFFLIVIGLLILGRIIFGRRCHYRHDYSHCHGNRDKNREFTYKKTDKEFGYIDRNYVFGGSKEKIDTKGFKGGEINCVFGGMELDLTDSELAEGVNVLEVNTVFGGVVLYVPLHWKVEIRDTQVFGHFEDKRPEPTFEVDEKRVLVVKTSSIFGGGEIKYKS